VEKALSINPWRRSGARALPPSPGGAEYSGTHGPQRGDIPCLAAYRGSPASASMSAQEIWHFRREGPQLPKTLQVRSANNCGKHTPGRAAPSSPCVLSTKSGPSVFFGSIRNSV
jgi:hypothetical protein